MNKKLKALRNAIGSALEKLPGSASVEFRRQALGAVLGEILPRFYPAEKVLKPETLLEVIVAMYLSIAPEWRFVAHEVIETAVEAWLPDSNPLKRALHDAISATHFATEAFLTRKDLTDEKIRAHLGPTLLERFNSNQTTGGHMAAAPIPPYANNRGKLESAVGAIFDRLLELAELGSRPGQDPHPQIEGVAAMLRTAIVEEIGLGNPTEVGKLVSFWPAEEITRLGDSAVTQDAQFLEYPRVSRLIGAFVAMYQVRHPGIASPETSDRIDNLLEGYGLPPWLREWMKRSLNLRNAENAVDRVENVVYPVVLALLRSVFCVVVIVLGLTLMAIGLRSALLGALGAECTIGKSVFPPAEFFLVRAGGAVLNHVVVVGTGFFYAIAGAVVGWPYKPRPATQWAPAQGWFERDDYYDARLVPLRAKASADEVAEYDKTIEEKSDLWRAQVRDSMIFKIGVVVWTLTVGTALVLLLGAIALAAQFQWVTALMVLSILFIVSLVVLWPVDDIANALSKRMRGEGLTKVEVEAADGGPKLVHVITFARTHKITTTVMIVVLAATIVYVPAIFLMPPLGARVSAFFAFIIAGLAAIFPSRMQAGDPSESQADLVKQVTKTRQFMVAKFPLIIASVGLGAFFLVILGGSGAYNAWNWYKECRGFEATPECSMFANGGLHTFVDSHDRWEAMRDRSANTLTKRKKSTGDACAIAQREIEKIDVQYRTYVLSSANGGVDESVCEILKGDGLLRGQFPNWARACATYRVACAKG